MSSLFRDLINDMNHYKNTSENLQKELDKYACEIANLKRENETLEQSAINLESILYNCLSLLNKVDFSKSALKEDYVALLENQWIKNYKNENKLEVYKSYDKLTVKCNSLNFPIKKITPKNKKLSCALSSENVANESSFTSCKSPCKDFRDLNEDFIKDQDLRKLNHGFLNIDAFKTKNWESGTNIMDRDVSHSKEDLISSFVMEENEDDDDDVIFESPKLPESTVIKKKKREGRDEQRKILVPEPNSDECQIRDLDETYISTAVINYHQLGAQKYCKAKEKSNGKQCNREKSPEYDSVPFFYKRNSLRKKSDRMKLPGQTCFNCNQYYKNIFGCDMSMKNFREILNKCSRHRDKTSQSLDNTPPGYWKPYLTASVISLKAENTAKKRKLK